MMFFQQLVKAITSGWKWIVIVILVVVSVSLAISATTVPIYRSQATFIIAPNKNLPSSRDVVSAFTALDTLNIFSTYSDILASERVSQEAHKNLEISESDLAQYSRATAMKPESLILELTVDGPDSQTASILANEIGKYGIQFINAYFSVFEIDFLDQATPPEETFRPRIYRDMGIAAGIGLVAGLIVVIVKEFMEIPLNQFIQRFSLDSESMAFTKRSIEKSMINMKARDNDWPITFILIYVKNLQEFLSVAPGFSRKRVTSEIVKKLKEQLKGNDLIGRWDDSTFSVVLPRTPKKVSETIENRLSDIFSTPFVYGVEESEQILLEPVAVSATSANVEEFETFVEDAELELKDLEW
jgi:capsular polysaccharide biosynthesis protein/GGDEF domain-containing protein